MSGYLHISEHTFRRMQRIQELLKQLQPEDGPQALVVPGSPTPQSGVIVFTGSFNPPTLAHLALLKQASLYAQSHEPMAVYAAVSKRTVDKENVERPLLVDRLLVLDDVLKRRLDNVGIMLFNRGLYVEQAEAVRASFPHVRQILFLLGFDKIVQIFDPHYYSDRDTSLHELFSSAELLVAPRGDDGDESLQALLQQPQNEQFARFVHSLPFNAQYRYISSTRVREGTDTHDVPREVRQFMRDTRAYAPPIHYTNGQEIDYYGLRMQLLQELLR